MFVHLTQTTITESMVVHFEDKTPGVLEFFPGRIRGRTGSYSGHFDRDGMTHITADQRGGVSACARTTEQATPKRSSWKRSASVPQCSSRDQHCVLWTTA